MPSLDYPCVFKCSSCGHRVEVTRAEALDVRPNADSYDAVDKALKQKHGWTRDWRGTYCPDCDPPSVEEGKRRLA